MSQFMRTLSRFSLFLLALGPILMFPGIVFASATLPASTAEQMDSAAAVFRGTVVGISTARAADGLIYTRTSLRVDESLKGLLPEIVAVEHRGGQVGAEDEFYGLSPKLVAGGEYLLFVRRTANQKLECQHGHASAMRLEREAAGGEFSSPGKEFLQEVRAIFQAGTAGAGSDVTDQAGTEMILPMATTGMLGGVNTRFVQPDRGEPIPVLIDATSLPAGITLQQATNAVLQALNAWANVTSLKFQIESIGSFGQGADQIAITDEKLRIQLHDNYNRINTANVLGIGGRNAFTSPTLSGWDLGGNVDGNEFRKSRYGYVVLEAGASSMQNLATFTEVLCHEIGHALNMAHSSEVTTADPLLFNSIMYFQAHADGRGATLGAYDPPIIRQCYPLNTPPSIQTAFPTHRVIDGVTASVPFDVPGVNEVDIRGYDLQNTPLTLVTADEDAPGAFTTIGSKLKYNAPVGNFADTGRFDPQVTFGSGYSYYDMIFARLSDGTNASPYTIVRVISLRRDSTSPPDGIPNYWMVNYFGSAAPSAGNLSRANDDADGDGLSTLQEFQLGTNPRSANSKLSVTGFTGNTMQFSAQGYELYEVVTSTNLATWSPRHAVVPEIASSLVRTTLPQTNILVTLTNLPTGSSQQFYRVRKVQ